MKIKYSREVDGRYIAEIPSIPGALAYGKTKAEALRAVLQLGKLVALDDMTRAVGCKFPIN